MDDIVLQAFSNSDKKIRSKNEEILNEILKKGDLVIPYFIKRIFGEDNLKLRKYSLILLKKIKIKEISVSNYPDALNFA